MIRLLQEREAASVLSQKGGWQLFRIQSLLRAYGTAYPFCRFYAQEESGALLCITGDEAILDAGEKADYPELAECLYASGVRRLSAVDPAGRRLEPFLGAAASSGAVMERESPMPLPAGEPLEHAQTMAQLRKAYDILSSCFSLGQFDGWYCDLSHQIRHETMSVYLLENSGCAVTVSAGDRFYLNAVAVLPEFQGKGMGSRMVQAVLTENKGKVTAVFSRSERTDCFYKRAGFCQNGQWFSFVL